MPSDGNMETAAERTWPLPNDPRFEGAGEETQRWIEASQPEALAVTAHETVMGAFRALSSLALLARAYPEAALENALAQLPPAQAEVLKAQLELSRTYGQDKH